MVEGRHGPARRRRDGLGGGMLGRRERRRGSRPRPPERQGRPSAMRRPARSTRQAGARRLRPRAVSSRSGPWTSTARSRADDDHQDRPRRLAGSRRATSSAELDSASLRDQLVNQRITTKSAEADLPERQADPRGRGDRRSSEYNEGDLQAGTGRSWTQAIDGADGDPQDRGPAGADPQGEPAAQGRTGQDGRGQDPGRYRRRGRHPGPPRGRRTEPRSRTAGAGAGGAPAGGAGEIHRATKTIKELESEIQKAQCRGAGQAGDLGTGEEQGGEAREADRRTARWWPRSTARRLRQRSRRTFGNHRSADRGGGHGPRAAEDRSRRRPRRPDADQRQGRPRRGSTSVAPKMKARVKVDAFADLTLRRRGHRDRPAARPGQLRQPGHQGLHRPASGSASAGRPPPGHDGRGRDRARRPRRCPRRAGRGGGPLRREGPRGREAARWPASNGGTSSWAPAGDEIVEVKEGLRDGDRSILDPRRS